MDILKKLASVLRGGKPEKQNAQSLSNKLMQAIGAKPEPEPKPYRIMVRGADGNLVSKSVTAQEALEYLNRDSQWRRIA